MRQVLLTFAIFVFLLGPGSGEPAVAQTVPTDPDKALFDSLKFRSIGPFRGGRSAACAGVRGNPMLYYMGAAGGGVWKTEDAGSTWSNILTASLVARSVRSLSHLRIPTSFTQEAVK